jgi:hypothetical protein
MRRKLAHLVVVTVSLSLLAGCGGSGGDDDDSSGCTPPNIEGSPVFTYGEGKAHGKGQLAAGVPNGLELDLELDAGDEGSGRIFSENLFGNATCGRTFSYTVVDIGPSTYRMLYKIRDPRSTSDVPLFQGTSTNTFTITKDENAAFDPVFAN